MCPRQAAEPSSFDSRAPVRVESGASFCLILHSSELAVSCLRKISKGAAPILLECVVELGTPKMQVTNGTRSVLAPGPHR